MENQKRSKYFMPLLLGAIWNIGIGLLGLLAPDFTNKLLFNDFNSITDIFTNYWWFLFVLGIGIGYGSVAFKHDRFRFLLTIGATIKILLFIVITYLWWNSTATHFAELTIIGDLLWAIYFFYFLKSTKEFGYF